MSKEIMGRDQAYDIIVELIKDRGCKLLSGTSKKDCEQALSVLLRPGDNYMRELDKLNEKGIGISINTLHNGKWELKTFKKTGKIILELDEYKTDKVYKFFYLFACVRQLLRDKE